MLDCDSVLFLHSACDRPVQNDPDSFLPVAVIAGMVLILFFSFPEDSDIKDVYRKRNDMASLCCILNLCEKEAHQHIAAADADAVFVGSEYISVQVYRGGIVLIYDELLRCVYLQDLCHSDADYSLPAVSAALKGICLVFLRAFQHPCILQIDQEIVSFFIKKRLQILSDCPLILFPAAFAVQNNLSDARKWQLRLEAAFRCREKICCYIIAQYRITIHCTHPYLWSLVKMAAFSVFLFYAADPSDAARCCFFDSSCG